MPDQPTELGLGFPQFGQLQKILNRNTGHRSLPKILINREAQRCNCNANVSVGSSAQSHRFR
jgi:hypothetical protein